MHWARPRSTSKSPGNPSPADVWLGGAGARTLAATGAPTRQEAAAAREELTQQRHASSQSGNGPDHSDPYSGRITLPAPAAPEAEAPAQAPPEPQVKGPDTI